VNLALKCLPIKKHAHIAQFRKWFRLIGIRRRADKGKVANVVGERPKSVYFIDEYQNPIPAQGLDHSKKLAVMFRAAGTEEIAWQLRTCFANGSGSRSTNQSRFEA
jgi:hypothetical protein